MVADAATDLATVDNTGGFLPGMSSLNIFKQLGLMIGLAASVALGVFIVLWGSEPDMRSLGKTDGTSAMDIVSYLEQQNIPYRFDPSGAIQVPQDRYQRITLELQSQGVMLGDSADQYLHKETGFGVSQQLEKARLQRSQEMQLAKTIAEFSGIRSAKVHLALPKETAFLKHRKDPSASVLLSLYGNRTLDDEQVRAIVDLVTGSVPNLESNKVTVTDQFGRLLHSGTQSNQERESNRELKIMREQQADYQSKIQQILLPIVGEGNFTVQVNVDMDFTKLEQTQQSFNPEISAVRSERTLENQSSNGAPTGVPGALSNQPPAAATIPENLRANGANNVTEQSGNRRVEAERNYDLDTTISHIKQQVGIVKKVSVSVGLDFIDNAATDDGSGTFEARIARPQNQIDNITRMIRGTIGFNANRGDLVEVESFDFVRPEQVPDLAPLPFYQQPLFQALWKPVTALLLGLILIFGFLKPLMNKLSTQPNIPVATRDDDDLGLGGLEADTLSLESEPPLELPGPAMPSSRKAEQAKGVAAQDPTMVAQLVKNWVEEDE